MKKILCYGDSNTWGCSPVDSSRFDEKTRWPMVMGSILGDGFTVFEEGLNGRTVLNLSPGNRELNGIDYAADAVRNYIPVDIVLVCLGTNDVFVAEEISLNKISDGIRDIICVMRENHISGGFRVPEVVIMSPPGFNESVEGAGFIQLQLNMLKGLSESYREIAAQNKCLFFNTSDFVAGSEIDGSHLAAESHILLGNRIAEFIISEIK